MIKKTKIIITVYSYVKSDNYNKDYYHVTIMHPVFKLF